MRSISKIGDQKLLQEMNRAVVLNTIYRSESISRIGISKITGLSQSTISNIVEILQNEGHVKVVGTGSSTKVGGRRPTMITIDKNSGYIISVAIVTEAFHILLRVCLFDLKLNMVDQADYEMAERGSDLIENIHATLTDFIQSHADKKMIGIGFSIPTVLNHSGVISRGHLLELENYPFKSEMEKRFPSLPIAVEQEQHAAILGERETGSAKGMTNLLYVTVGRGIGSSVIANNQLILGEYGGAGEIGHMTINKFGAKCICGKFGCLRLYATELVFINKIKEAIMNEIPIPYKIYNPNIDKINVIEVYHEAVQGDPFSRELLFSMLDNLCVGLSNLVYLMNPRKIIIGGNLILAKDIAIPYISERLTKIVDLPGASLDIVEASLGKDSSLYGAATIVLSKYFLKKELIHTA